MATVYSVPPDSKEKEKIIGGYITLGQGAWLMLGFVIGFAFTLLFYGAFPILAVIIGLLLFVGIGGTFAFYKKEGIPFFRYLVLKERNKRKTKHLPSFK